ncbi:hypothetical protein CL97_gp066 [Cronobacter phage CR9]|uniref:Uncharacterized protein n=1 Tax=Cronobacter phage CR9 TaxID=1162290 RepID=M1F3H1_9CAUD|nr:hypothetical protein CL97_gp066 [Cronobacter phage CR9]AFH20950.1 hypothetical protein CR9_066 [Cronobacter phage CR9]
MNDYRGTPLKEGDKVAIYWGYNSLETAIIHNIQGKVAKVRVQIKHHPRGAEPYIEEVLSKWKRGDCMVKLPD